MSKMLGIQHADRVLEGRPPFPVFNPFEAVQYWRSISEHDGSPAVAFRVPSPKVAVEGEVGMEEEAQAEKQC